PDLNLKEDEEIPAEVLARLEITKDDFAQSLKNIRPSAMREFSVESPNVKWEDIGGLENLKQQLTEMIEWPLKNPQAFSRLGIVAPKGILLYGPPGTGKTLLAKAVATETACNFIYVKGPEVINKYVGESERAVRKIFQKARQNSPCILFFDEFDAIGATRMGGNTGKATDKIVTQILTEMDGLENLVNVKVIAATNRPGLIDPALLRPGRFDKLVLVDIPDERARMSILKIHVSRMPIEDGDMLVSHLAQKTEGYVGADLEALVREAGLIALRRNIKCEKVTKEDFDEALKVIRPSVNVELRKHYAEIENEMKNPKKEVTDNLSMSSYM
ncbi:MAG: AAA family ATPase, partial [Nanoarchaeota archaeon]